MPSQAERRAATTAAILAAARGLFDSRGFEGTSIDDIAQAAGVAKGAVYHHYPSKEAVFAAVLEALQAEIAGTPVPPEDRKLTDPLDQVAAGVLRYLTAASAPGVKQILLVDGPAVIGWRGWREIDDRYFGAGALRVVAHLLGPGATEAQIAAQAHLLMGAVMEAALVCASAADPRQAAVELSAALRRMLAGLGSQSQSAPVESPPLSASP